MVAWQQSMLNVDGRRIPITISPQGMPARKFDGQAFCPATECKFKANIRSKTSQNAVIKAAEKKFREHFPKCPKKS